MLCCLDVLGEEELPDLRVNAKEVAMAKGPILKEYQASLKILILKLSRPMKIV